MSIQTPTNVPEQTQSQGQDLGNLSFAEYQAARRGERVESKAQSAPVEETEQKEPTDSEPVETEAKEESDAESEESDEADESSKDKPKKKGGFQRRIDKLNARYAEERQRRELLEARLAQLEGGGGKKEEPKVEKTAEPAGKPKPDDFETYSEYTEALTDWKLEQREKLARAEAEKSKLLSQQEQLMKAHQDRVKAFADKTEDFFDVLENLDGIRSVALEQLILESDNGPELLYELAKNPDEAKRIASLSPLAAAREMGKIETKIQARASEEKKPEPKKLTKAPKPIEPVGGNKGAVAKSIDDPSISFQDYVKLRSEKRRG